MNARASDPAQPHIVQLAAILTSDLGQTIDSYSFIVKPDGWTIPDDASAIHGITNEVAKEIGIPEKDAITALRESIANADLLVAHNVTFDKFIARIAMRRFGLLTDDQDAWWKAIPTDCTMRKLTDVCKIPSPNGRGYKWPKLSEAYQFAFGKPLEGAHDALKDVTACKELYFWLLSKGGAK